MISSSPFPKATAFALKCLSFVCLFKSCPQRSAGDAPGRNANLCPNPPPLPPNLHQLFIACPSHCLPRSPSSIIQLCSLSGSCRALLTRLAVAEWKGPSPSCLCIFHSICCNGWYKEPSSEGRRASELRQVGQCRQPL